MAKNRPMAEIVGVPLTPFVPAVVLVLAVAFLVNTEQYYVLGLFSMFGAFVGGVGLLAVSVVSRLFSGRYARLTFVLGLSLGASAVLLYLVYGCVLGCPA